MFCRRRGFEMAVKQKPVFDYLICVACGLCDQACPVSCLELSK
ncbi:methionine ABC transporter, partial [bacterium]